MEAEILAILNAMGLEDGLKKSLDKRGERLNQVAQTAKALKDAALENPFVQNVIDATEELKKAAQRREPGERRDELP